MKKLLPLFLLPTFFFFSACGQESPEESLGSSAENFVQASLDGDWSSFCDSLSQESQKNLTALLRVAKGTTCPEALEKRESLVGPRIKEQAKDNKLGQVKVKGVEGEALLQTPRGEQVLPAVLENGEWKLNLFPSAG